MNRSTAEKLLRELLPSYVLTYSGSSYSGGYTFVAFDESTQADVVVCVTDDALFVITARRGSYPFHLADPNSFKAFCNKVDECIAYYEYV